MTRDPWAILEVDPGADAAEVRAAWRRQVRKWHPDRNRAPEATARLQQINDAYASIEHGAVREVRVRFTEPILAGVSGTVFGRRCRVGEAIAPGSVRRSLEIPAPNWAADQPVTLGIRLSADFATIITLLHPGRYHDGSVLVFPRSGVTPAGTVTDLLVTLRVAVPAVEPPPPRQVEAVLQG